MYKKISKLNYYNHKYALVYEYWNCIATWKATKMQQKINYQTKKSKWKSFFASNI